MVVDNHQSLETECQGTGTIGWDLPALIAGDGWSLLDMYPSQNIFEADLRKG